MKKYLIPTAEVIELSFGESILTDSVGCEGQRLSDKPCGDEDEDPIT